MKKVLMRLLQPQPCLWRFPRRAAQRLAYSTTLLRFNQDARTGLAYQDTDAGHRVPRESMSTSWGTAPSRRHLYGWGRFTSRTGASTTTRGGRPHYAYLQYRFDAANAQARAGRFFIDEGIVTEQVDGVSARGSATSPTASSSRPSAAPRCTRSPSPGGAATAKGTGSSAAGSTTATEASWNWGCPGSTRPGRRSCRSDADRTDSGTTGWSAMTSAPAPPDGPAHRAHQLQHRTQGWPNTGTGSS